MCGCCSPAVVVISQESLDAYEAGELGVHDLDRHLAVVADVVGQIHVGHAAGAELPLDRVAVRERRLQTVEGIHVA